MFRVSLNLFLVRNIKFISENYAKTSILNNSADTNISNNMKYFCTIPYKNNYSENETSKILKIINENDTLELSKYNISKMRIQKIAAWKAKNGSLTSLSQLLELDSFGIKVLDKFCDSILDEKLQKKEVILQPASNRRVGQYLTPPLSDLTRAYIKCCVAIHIGIGNISWARLELNNSSAPIELTDWKHVDIVDKKLHLSDLVQIVLYINHLIPEADTYIMENRIRTQTAGPGISTAQININIQKTQIAAMISVILTNRKFDPAQTSQLLMRKTLKENETSSSSDSDSEDDQIEHQNTLSYKQQTFYMRPYLAARLFGTLVGSERVSSEKVIRDLIQPTIRKITDDTPKTAELFVSDKLKNVYEEADGIEKEYLGQALLLGLCFMKLCILKCPESISSLNRKRM